MNMETLLEIAHHTKKGLAYCDYIAHLIQKNLKANDSTQEKLLSSVGNINFDLKPDGSYGSTKKTIQIEDRYGKKYLITVEEA